MVTSGRASCRGEGARGRPAIKLRGVTAIVALLLAATACASGGGESEESGAAVGLAACAENPLNCNSGPVKQGGTYTHTIEKDIANWNINSVEGNVFETGLVTGTLLPQVFLPQPDFTLKLNDDLMESAELTSTEPQVVTYKIKPAAVWNDGTPVTGKDLEFQWKSQGGKDCPADQCQPSSTSGYELIDKVETSSDGKTVTVTFGKPYTDWRSLFGGGNQQLYPGHIAEREGGSLDTAAGLAKATEYFAKTVPTYSAGPYKIENFQKNTAVTLVPNDKWYGKTKPSLDRLIFRIITDATQEPTALANNEVQGIYPQPQVDLVEQIKQNPNVTYSIGKGLQWEHFDLNLENEFLKDKALRQALFTAVDRKAIIDKTVGQFAPGIQPLNSNNFVPGAAGYQDVITPTGQGGGNIERAKQILTEAGYRIQGDKLITPDGETVPTLRIRYTTGNAIRQTTCELFAQQVRPLGVNVKVETTDDLGGTLAGGDFDVMLFAWVAGPSPAQNAEQNWISTSESNFGHWVNEESDRLIRQAAQLPGDQAKAYQLLNQANSIMAEDAYVLPLFQKPTFLAVNKQFVNIRDNATNVGPTYNVQEWGLRG